MLIDKNFIEKSFHHQRLLSKVFPDDVFVAFTYGKNGVFDCDGCNHFDWVDEYYSEDYFSKDVYSQSVKQFRDQDKPAIIRENDNKIIKTVTEFSLDNEIARLRHQKVGLKTGFCVTRSGNGQFFNVAVGLKNDYYDANTILNVLESTISGLFGIPFLNNEEIRQAA